MASKSPTTHVVSFFVHGEPAPGGSKTFIPRRYANGKLAINMTSKGKEMPAGVMVDAGKHNAKWKRIVAAYAREAHTGTPLDCALEMSVVFYRLRPKSHYGTGRNAGILKASAPGWPRGKPDTLKLARSTEDALTGIIWTDDARVVDQRASKRYGNRAGAQIDVWRMEATLTDLDNERKGE